MQCLEGRSKYITFAQKSGLQARQPYIPAGTTYALASQREAKGLSYRAVSRTNPRVRTKQFSRGIQMHCVSGIETHGDMKSAQAFEAKTATPNPFLPKTSSITIDVWMNLCVPTLYLCVCHVPSSAIAILALVQVWTTRPSHTIRAALVPTSRLKRRVVKPAGVTLMACIEGET